VEWLPEIADSLTDPEAFELGRTVGELAEGVCERRLACGGRAERSAAAAGLTNPAGGDDPVLGLLDESLARIERRYPEVLARVTSRAARSRLAKLIFLIEAAGSLDDKEPLSLYLVAPRERLAGDFMGSFGGMFRREWRDADFRAGRRDARSLLETALGDVVSYEPDSDDAYAVPDLDTSMAALSSGQRRRLEEHIETMVDRTIGEVDAGFLASVFGFAWKPALRRWATRRALEALERAT
jgi:hypothetical protein